MHPNLIRLPDRAREIVLQECAVGVLWVGNNYANLDMIFAPRGGKYSSYVRDAIWWRCREELGVCGKPPSTTQIGKWFGRDHTSVIAGLNRHEGRFKEWAEVKQRHYQLQRGHHLAWAMEACPNIKAA